MSALRFLILWLPATALAADGGVGQARFEAATAEEARGDFAAAADALERLGHELPEDPFADDALFEAAVVAEERLHDPARAARLYDEVATRFPQSRLTRRARTRADFLRSSLRTGEAPLREYQDIVAQASRAPAAAAARMERLLADHPDFALADRALYWLGTAYVELGRLDAAEARLADVERRFPGSDWAARAAKARGDLTLRRGHPYRARAIFAELAHASDPIARAAGREGLDAVQGALRRAAALAASLVYLAAFVGVHAWRLRGRRRAAIPVELIYYGPVALLFVIAAATENSAIGWATLGIAVGGALIIWLAGALGVEPSVSVGARLARAAATALAVLALMVVVVQSTGLTDLILETLRSGPER
jgi:TolA-binding protein